MLDTTQRRLLRAATAFRAADAEATKQDWRAALENAGVLAGRCAQAEGLPTHPEWWDQSGRCVFVWAVMTLGWCGHGWEDALLRRNILDIVDAHQVRVDDGLDQIAA